jgi:stage 0 sporulation regulatory protein
MYYFSLSVHDYNVLKKNGEMKMFMLKIAIELKRRKMTVLANRYGFTAWETVKCSQELDQLLNIYQKTKQKKLKLVN